MIVIDTGDTPNVHGIKRLAACAYYGSGGDPGTVIVTDLNCGYTVTTNYPVSGGVYMASTPDVIIGNNTSSAHPTEDFIMAVAFMNNSGNV